MKTILVTGGLGYIGSHVCLDLIKKEWKVVILDNLSNSNLTSLKNIECISGTKIPFYKLGIEDDLSEIFNIHDIYAVIHFAGYKSSLESINNPIKYFQNNVSGTINLLQEMERFKCYNIVFSSSAAIYQEDPDGNACYENSKISASNPYGETKATVERILLNLGKEWSVIALRYFNCVGNHDSGLIKDEPDVPANLFPCIIKAKKENKKFSIFGNDYDTKDGTCYRDYIHVLDLSLAHVKALEKLKLGFSAFNIGTGKATSVLEIIDAFKEIGYDIDYEFKPRRDGDVSSVFCNNEKALRELDWTPQRTIEEMCKSALL